MRTLIDDIQRLNPNALAEVMLIHQLGIWRVVVDLGAAPIAQIEAMIRQRGGTIACLDVINHNILSYLVYCFPENICTLLEIGWCRYRQVKHANIHQSAMIGDQNQPIFYVTNETGSWLETIDNPDVAALLVKLAS